MKLLILTLLCTILSGCSQGGKAMPLVDVTCLTKDGKIVEKIEGIRAPTINLQAPSAKCVVELSKNTSIRIIK